MTVQRLQSNDVIVVVVGASLLLLLTYNMKTHNIFPKSIYHLSDNNDRVFSFPPPPLLSLIYLYSFILFLSHLCQENDPCMDAIVYILRGATVQILIFCQCFI